MKYLHHLQRALAMAACVGLLMPRAAVWADDPVPAAPAVLDIKLDQNGAFGGGMFNADGAAIPGAVVQLQRDSETVVQELADPQGRFTLHPPQAGNYQLVSGQQVAHIRCWASTVAPPHAQNQVQFVQSRIERGQSCTDMSCTTPSCGGGFGSGLCSFLMNPLVIGTAIAAAIAIPLALDDDDDAS